MYVILQDSDKKYKKYKVTINGKNIYFGAKGYEDYTIHHDPYRQEQYLNRHAKREDWTKSGIHTPGFWSRWLLWNKPDIYSSIQNIEHRFHLKILLSY